MTFIRPAGPYRACLPPPNTVKHSNRREAYLAVVFNVNIKCSHCTMDHIYIIILFAISCNNPNITVITYHHANSYSCKLNPEDRFHRDIFHWTTLADSTNINSTREYLNSLAGSRCLLSSVMQIIMTEISFLIVHYLNISIRSLNTTIRAS